MSFNVFAVSQFTINKDNVLTTNAQIYKPAWFMRNSISIIYWWTLTGAFSCSFSISFKVNDSLRRFSKSLPSLCSCSDVKSLLKCFIHPCPPPSFPYPFSQSLTEIIWNEACHSVFGGKSKQGLDFLPLFPFFLPPSLFGWKCLLETKPEFSLKVRTLQFQTILCINES